MYQFKLEKDSVSGHLYVDVYVAQKFIGWIEKPFDEDKDEYAPLFCFPAVGYSNGASTVFTLKQIQTFLKEFEEWRTAHESIQS